jgi:uncharacterized membrane protein
VKRDRRHAGYWQLAIAAPIAAAIAHIITTFSASSNLNESAYARLAGALPNNAMAILDPIAPGNQPLPFMSAESRYAICRFSTASGPVRVNAVLPDVGWSLGVFKRDGASAYFAAAAPGRPTQIALTIVPDDDRFLGMTPQALGESIDVSPRLSVAAKEGLVVVRAPDAGPSQRDAAQTGLAKSVCASVSY